MTRNVPRIEVVHDDVAVVPAEVLVLKHAQDFLGADKEVARRLIESGVETSRISPREGQVALVSGRGGLASDQVLFVGVPPIYDFAYREIRIFARTALSALKRVTPEVSRVAMTIHGPGIGLDDAEAFEAQIAGLFDAIEVGEIPRGLREIVIVEWIDARVQRLRERLGSLLPEGPEVVLGGEPASRRSSLDSSRERLRAAGYASRLKKNIFVAIPFEKHLDDIYFFGIQGPVQQAGFLCERADLASFTGDIQTWIRQRIERASAVIAELTDVNPNVFLEVGYAWGCGVPTILLVKNAERLPFDIRSHRCLVYDSIKVLHDKLATEIAQLGI